MKKDDWMLGGVGALLFGLGMVFQFTGVLHSMGFVESFFLAAVVLLFTLYRPVWAFLLLILLLPLETLSLIPEQSGLRVRPYQLLTVCLYGALIIRFLSGRLRLGRFRPVWADWLLLVFGASSFVSAFASAQPKQSLKQTVIVWSFLALYFLTRYFVRSERDIRRVVPFAALSSVMVFGLTLWQSLRDRLHQPAFEVMVGRPNSSLTEADWLGFFGVLLLAGVLAAMSSHQSRGTASKNENSRKDILRWLGRWMAGVGAVLLLALTVTRSAWLAGGVLMPFFVLWLFMRWRRSQESGASMIAKLSGMLTAGIVGVLLGTLLTPFSLGQRAASTGGWQTITVACAQPLMQPLPETIGRVDDLAAYGCRHINLETIEQEKQSGSLVTTVNRPDPNVSIRATIYAKVREVLRVHPVIGIGWGSIGDILGRDANGAALNASNIFLEVWLGAGLIGGIAFALVWLGIGALAGTSVWRELFDAERENPVDRSALPIFFLLSWIGGTVFNFFNSGILLGFVWVWLAIAVSAVTPKNVLIRETTDCTEGKRRGVLN